MSHACYTRPAKSAAARRGSRAIVASMSVRALSCLVLGVAACGPSSTPDPKVLPPSPKFITGNLEPMVVDWQPEERGDLEISMREGLVVVGYDESGFRLLKDCHVDGNYEFMGMTRRERVVRLESADDVKANLPLGGLGIAAKLGGEFEQGATLDIAMVMIGKLRTTWRTVTPADLKGQCQSASHFVRGATVGAFAVDKGDRSHARAVAEIFGVGAGGGTAKSSMIRIIDGQLPDCQRALPDSDKAPSQCGALIRVELLPIAGPGEDAKAKALGDRQPSLVDQCEKPLVRIEGKCTDPRTKPTAVAECTYGEAQSCLDACKAESSKSCVKLAFMLAKGEGATQDLPNAAKLAEHACSQQDASGCVLYGDLLSGGAGVPRNLERAARVYAKACDDGEAQACANVGTQLLAGRGVAQDTKAAARALSKGCKGGSQDACSDLGLLAMGGNGFDKDLPTAAALFKRACDGSSSVGCSNYAYMAEFGQGMPQNLPVALRDYTKACEADHSMCTWLGAMYEVGRGVPKDSGKAAQLYRAACVAGHPAACAFVKSYLDPTQRIEPESFNAYVNVWKGTCQAGGPRDCSGLGVLALSAGSRDEAQALFTRSCKLGDAWGCLLGTLKPKL